MTQIITDAVQSLQLLNSQLENSLRRPPDATDGKYDYEVDDKISPALASQIIAKISTFLPKGTVATTLAGAVDKFLNPDAENDRLGAFETILTIMSMVPSDSTVGKALSNKAIGVLYNALPHPVDTYLGSKYTFRQADGGSNNVHLPDLGRAGMPYARSVQPKRAIDPQSLPDPGLVFDVLLKARDRVDHLGGNSSLTFAFAILVTHSIFKTGKTDQNINEASSYLDLSPLYGNNQAEVDSVRDPDSNGRGLLRRDTFADGELGLLPPACSALLVLFNRNHNYIANMLLRLNEKKRWSDPPPSDPEKLKAQDDEIFETARLVNGGHFMSLIMNDYVAGFLGLSEGNAWNMPAFDPIKYLDGEVVERGHGNHVSAEFNVLYRWHTTISAADEAVQDPVDEMDLQTFIPLLVKEVWNADATPPHARTFAGLQRGPDGKFADDSIAKILLDATESAAGQYRARGTPSVMKPIEILGIIQARSWGLCTMNEFRQFLGLKRFESFEEWNPDKDVAATAQRLYGHIDNLELYVGLQCEEYMPLSPGLRFSCGYTMTRAVLSDAIALIRGDRFYTTCNTPASLTTWGFQDATTRPSNGGFNGHLPKLLMRHFPRYYPFNSVYGIFPFFTPKKMKDSLTRQGIASRYTFDRPVPTPLPKFIDNFTSINFVFNDPSKFVSGYNMSGLGDGYGFFLAFDDVKKHDTDRDLCKQATVTPSAQENYYAQWFHDTIIAEINAQSWKAGDKLYVDIWQVIKTVHVRWAAEELCGISLKTNSNPHGTYTVDEVWTILRKMIFLGLGDVERFWSLVEKATKASVIVQGIVKNTVARYPAPPKTIVGGLLQEVGKTAGQLEQTLTGGSAEPCAQFIKRLTSSGRPANQLIAMVVSLAVGSSVNQAQAVVNVLDFYLEESRKNNYSAIQSSIQKGDDKTLQGYVREAMRLDPQFTGLWRVSKVASDVPGSDVKLNPGDFIWGGFKKAHRNPADFPDPLTVDPTRDPSKYQLNGGGFHQCIGVAFAVRVIADTLKVVYSLKNVRRGPGDSGHMHKITKVINEVETNQYLESDGTLSDWPTPMIISYDP
ncbi:heme peroxidase [Phlebopus sp. FC_14]|nr:heme peroxidase [Phlebopus sp. FC_14]